MHRNSWAIAISLAAIACFSVLFFSSVSPALAPPAQIAFQSAREGSLSIYTIDADGSEPKQLTRELQDEGLPSWSPDRQKIAFVSNQDLNREIYVINADGSDRQRLTINPAWEFSPTWSPDGEKIAFSSDREGNQDIFAMNADGTRQTNLTNHPAVERSPDWSPDGDRILFTSNRADGQSVQIYIMNADGSNPIQLSDRPGIHRTPAWSPDGDRIAFSFEPLQLKPGYFVRDAEIYVMNADGTNPINLTQNPSRDLEPTWSPDGRQLAFRSTRNGNDFIYTIDRDGSNAKPIIEFPQTGAAPDWY
ncbi:DPP IV N-terminal domain-containing protein [Roseofilum casamattae]|uniref:DPP IV N-terminal domain-containing protein n=1 Tax=Roseofilum casamattae BLCC-M143 TaxID=3022442 RepID=A0ABT7BVA9_9CYAN|nr:DPP IV N-terminal domain-containing protein [Roseofilum casamattae]MDJ1183131.1 DPP IV N-terminal domain-containing protein [Roseofilum casamattae BLCC-M143]